MHKTSCKRPREKPGGKVVWDDMKTIGKLSVKSGIIEEKSYSTICNVLAYFVSECKYNTKTFPR